MPVLVESPVSAHDQTLRGMLEDTVSVAINLAAVAQRLNPHPPGVFAACGLTQIGRASCRERVL